MSDPDKTVRFTLEQHHDALEMAFKRGFDTAIRELQNFECRADETGNRGDCNCPTDHIQAADWLKERFEELE